MDIEDNADDSQVSEQSQQIEDQIIHDLAQFQLSQMNKKEFNPQSLLEQIDDGQGPDQQKQIMVKNNHEEKPFQEQNPIKLTQQNQEANQKGSISQAIQIEDDQRLLTWPQKEITIVQPKPFLIDDLMNDEIKAPVPRQIEKQEQTKNEQQIEKPIPHQPVKIPYAEQALLQIHQNQVKINEQAEELHNQSKWTPLDANFSQSKTNLIFTQKYNSNEFWKGIVSNNAFNTFINLFPKPLFMGIRKLLNDQISAKFVNQQIPNGKFFSNDAIYQYFGIKILMGYNRMPSTDDYFNDKLPFRSKICELYKKGRFDFAEDQIKITDDIALRIKQTKQEFNEFQEQKTIKGEIIPYLTKKMNKLFRLACDPGQNLVIIKDECFNYYDNIKEQEVTLLLLIDSQKQFILTIAFSYLDNISNAIFRMVEPYKNNNHKLYLQAGLLNIDEVNQLRENYKIYASCILAKSKRDNFVFTKDLISNGSIMVLRLTNPNGEMSGAMASTADGFHRTGPNDKRSFAPQQMQKMLTNALQIINLQEKYSCNFIKQNYNQILFQKIQEIVIWNSYVAYKNIQRIDPDVEYMNFRIELAKGLLEKKLKDLPQTIIIPLNQRLNTVGTNTDVTGNVDVKARENIPFSNFHIPTKLVAPQGFKIKIICLVCKKDYNTIVSCRSCSEQQKKVIAVCASECFSIFHTSLEYSRAAAEIPIMKQSAQYEQSNIAQNTNYQQTFKKSQMLEQAQKKQKQQTNKQQSQTDKKVNNKKNQILQNILEDDF